VAAAPTVGQRHRYASMRISSYVVARHFPSIDGRRPIYFFIFIAVFIAFFLGEICPEGCG